MIDKRNLDGTMDESSAEQHIYKSNAIALQSGALHLAKPFLLAGRQAGWWLAGSRQASDWRAGWQKKCR